MPWLHNFWIKAIFISLITLITISVLYTLKILIIPMTIGFIFAFLLEPIVSRLEGRKFNRITGIAVVFSTLALLMVGLFWVTTPIIVKEIKDIKANKDKYTSFYIEKYNETKNKIETAFPETIPWNDIEKKTYHYTVESSNTWVGQLTKIIAGSIETALSYIIIIPLMAFFILKDGHLLKRWLLQFVPNRYFELSIEILHNINHQTGAFMRGQILDSGINAIMVSTLLFIIGLPYYLILGVFAGIANAIPFVGPITAGSLAVLVSIIVGGPSPWIVIIVFVLAHLVDVMVIYPKTVGHSLNLHELVVILGIILGGHLGGVLGMLVIIPLIGILFRSVDVMYRLLKGYHIL